MQEIKRFKHTFHPSRWIELKANEWKLPMAKDDESNTYLTVKEKKLRKSLPGTYSMFVQIETTKL